MKTRILGGLVLGLALALPLVSTADVIVLKDGTRLVGTVLRWDGDSLLVETDFSTRPLRLHRDRVESIMVGEAAETPEAPEEAGGTSEAEAAFEPAPAETGYVHVVLTGDQLYSRVRFRRRPQREEAEKLNDIYFRVFVDGEKVFEEVDDETDRVLVRGGETVLRNYFERNDYVIAVPAGTHRFRFYIGNQYLSQGPYREKDDILATQVEIDELTVDPAAETLVRLVGKGRFMGFGDHRLIWEPLLSEMPEEEE
jgi:hypothetical protein